MAYRKHVPVVVRCVLGWCCLSIMGMICPAIAVTRSLAVQQVSLYQQDGLDGQPAFVVRARTVAENLAGQPLATTVTLRRVDGQPLRLGTSSPPFYREKNGAIVYTWSAPGADGVDLNDLFALFPIPLISGGTTPCDVIVRFAVKCGDLTAYLDAQTSFPSPVPERTRLLQMGNLRVSLDRENRSAPAGAGLGIDRPGPPGEPGKLLARLDFAVGGIQGQSAYAGLVNRLATGGIIQAAAACPDANIGNGSRVQVQRSETIRINPSRWNGYQLEMPVNWLELDRTSDQDLVAGIYTSAAGLWGYGEVAWALPARVTDDPGVAVAPSGKTLSRYTVPLRDILIELQQVDRRLLALQRQDREPDQEQVRTCGQELARIGGTFKALCGDSAMTAQTRIGFIEDLDLFQQIADVQEAAADRFMTLAVLPEEAREEMRPGQPVGMLEQVGRELIEKEVTDWITRKGFGDLLAQDSQNQLGGKVNKRLELDLAGYLNRKSVEVAGMPLRGFRSMKAALRLQARRKIRELVAELVVDFTGNRLVLMLLQNTILDWAENQLWPQLREAFRPKGNLEHRVDISVETMQQARRRLFQLSAGRDPGLIPLDEVLQELNRAAGTVHASRYLEKDLAGTADDALRSRFNSELNNLTQAMRVVMGQFLLYEDFMSESGRGRLATLNDLSDHIMGIQEDVLYVLGRMDEGLHELNILHPSDSEKLDALGGSIPFKWAHAQQYLVRLNGLKAEDLEGLKRLSVWVNEHAFILYGVPDIQLRQLEFKGFLPTPPGRYVVRMACGDVPGVPQEEWLIQVAASPGSETLQRCVARARQRINTGRSRLNQMNTQQRAEELHYQASLCLDAAGCSFSMGDLNSARNWAADGIQLANQSGSPHARDSLFKLYRTMAMVELFAGNLSGHEQSRQQEIEARLNWIRFRDSMGSSRHWDPSTRAHAFLEVARAAFETADMLLVWGVPKERVNTWVELGRKHGRLSGLDTHVAVFHPNVAAVFGIQ